MDENQSKKQDKYLGLELQALQFINKGNIDKAKDIYRDLIDKGSDNHVVYGNLAILYGIEGRNKEMIKLLKKSLYIEPKYSLGHNNLGLALQKEKDFNSAIDSFKRAIKLQPNYSEAYSNLGQAMYQNSQFEEAITSYKEALKIDPKNMMAYMNLAISYDEKDEFDLAIACYKKALEINPLSSEIYTNLGNSFLKQEKIDDSIACYKKSININPSNSKTHNNLGTAYKKKGLADEAVSEYKQAVKLNPYNLYANFNLGVFMDESDDFTSAINAYKVCINLNPKYVDAYTNLAIVYQEVGSIKLAIDTYKQALHIDPHNIKSRWNLALAQLLSGDYQNGLKNYEWRFKNKNSCKLHSSPSSESVVNNIIKTKENILVITEQGLGDTIQYMRYIPYLRNKGIKVCFSAQQKLHNLIKSSSIDDNPLTPEEANIINDRRWIPLLSLPKQLGVTPNNPIISDPYIKPKKELLIKWKNLLSYEKNPVVGINWQGSLDMEKKSYKGRSIPLEIFSILLKNNNITFLSLQKGYGSEQLKYCSFKNRFVSCQQEIDQIWDFSENAAIAANCNLIISCDTSVAHLAGGMGKKVWLLLKDIPFWTWGLHGNTSFWYPSMRLFRQERKYDWAGLMEEVAIELKKELTNFYD